MLTNGGTVEGLAPEGTLYEVGQKITLKAVPDKITANGVDYYYNFIGWYLNDELINTDLEFTTKVKKDAVYTAKFDPSATFIYYSDETVVVDTNNTLTKTSGYKGDTNITKVIIGGNITTIGESAFEGCSGLEEVEFAKSNLYVDRNAFYECTSLQEIDLNNVERLGNQSFMRCTNLEKVYAPKLKNTLEHVFNRCTSLQDVQFGSKGNPVESLYVSTFQWLSQNIITVKIYLNEGKIRLDDEQWRVGRKYNISGKN